MKIIHIIPSLQTGGAERLALDICIELNQRNKHDVLLIILNDINNFKHFDFIKYIASEVKLSLRSSNEFNTSILQKEIVVFKPDIIHTHLFEAEIVARSISYPKAKWFSHFHDNMHQLKNLSSSTFLNKKLITNFYEKQYLLKRYKANGGNQFISISKNTNNYATKVLPKWLKFHYLNNAINFDKFNIKKNNESDNVLQLINVGSFQEVKNQKFLIEIAIFLKKSDTKFHLWLLGEGNLKGDLVKKVKELKLQNEITFTGNVTNVQDYLTKCDIYIHSSFSEAFGLVLVEAMAAGLPVITSDGKGNRDIIEEGKNGYMIFDYSVEKFANTILKLWHNKEKLKSMSNYANQYAKQYDIVNYVDKLLEIYQNTIDLK